MNLRESARGEDCTLNIAGVCTYNVDTTVLAHLRFAGFGGIGKKPDDLCGVFACHRCHDTLDARAESLSREDWLFYALRGLARTHMRMAERGLIKVQGRRAA
jgi:hypothetical protein